MSEWASLTKVDARNKLLPCKAANLSGGRNDVASSLGNSILSTMLVLLAALTFLTAPSSDACSVVEGSVKPLDSTPLPDPPGLINMDVIYRFEISVKRVLRGPQVPKRITFFKQSHAQPIYQGPVAIRRRADGTYEPCTLHRRQ